MSKIIRGYADHGMNVRNRFCYYRDNNGKEIDLMILENGRLYPIEIKKGAEPEENALKNSSVLEGLPEEIGEGAVVCIMPVAISLDKKNKIIPVKCIYSKRFKELSISILTKVV